MATAVDEIAAAPKSSPAADVEPVAKKADYSPSEEASDSESLQAGVRRAEMLRKGWTRQGLIITFTGYSTVNQINKRPALLILDRLFLASLVNNFGDYSTQVYVPYATSSFKQHSAMSAANVVANITRIAAYPIIAKLGDVRPALVSWFRIWWH